MKEKEIKLKMLKNEYNKLKIEYEKLNNNEIKNIESINKITKTLFILSLIELSIAILEQNLRPVTLSLGFAFLGVLTESCKKGLEPTIEGYSPKEIRNILNNTLNEISDLQEELLDNEKIVYNKGNIVRIR